MAREEENIEIVSFGECLNMEISIPEYQRPYKWTVKNISDLLSDISHAIQERVRYAEFKYRIGTIILHREGKLLQVVDGQQRLISLTLLNHYLDNSFHNCIMNQTFEDRTTLRNIHQNYCCISEWFAQQEAEKKSAFLDALKTTLEVVVIYVEKESAAFQLFDSQNTRGRALDPHDLLKAFHLREMDGNSYDMKHAVTKWEAKEVGKIRELFSDYLFPIYNWSRGRKTWNFTEKDIDTYKGVPRNCPYTFARRALKAMPCFQITEPFIAGSDFFEMTDHYLRLLNNIDEELKNRLEEEQQNKDEKQEKNAEEKKQKIIAERMHHFIYSQHCSIGLRHVRKLYKAALLMYYDRFHQFDFSVIKKLFMWAFMLRIELSNLGYDSVNRYAVGEDYNNAIPVFSIISQARDHRVINNLIISVPDVISGINCKDERNCLLDLLKIMKQ